MSWSGRFATIGFIRSAPSPSHRRHDTPSTSLTTLLALRSAKPGFVTHDILAVNLPVTSFRRTPEQVRGFSRDVQRKLSAVPGADRVAFGSVVPWRDAGNFGDGFRCTVERRTRELGIRLAIGVQPRTILTSVLAEGLWMSGIGVVAGAAAGFAITRIVGSDIQDVQLP